jgi:hypothetical protein
VAKIEDFINAVNAKDTSGTTSWRLIQVNGTGRSRPRRIFNYLRSLSRMSFPVCVRLQRSEGACLNVSSWRAAPRPVRPHEERKAMRKAATVFFIAPAERRYAHRNSTAVANSRSVRSGHWPPPSRKSREQPANLWNSIRKCHCDSEAFVGEVVRERY